METLERPPATSGETKANSGHGPTGFWCLGRLPGGADAGLCVFSKITISPHQPPIVGNGWLTAERARERTI